MSNRSALELSTRTVRIYSGAADAQARTDIAEHTTDETQHVLTVSASHLVLGQMPVNATNDAGAAAVGVPIGGLYRSGSALMVRVA